MVKYEWIAWYQDGTFLKQFEGDKENLFADIILDNLHKFEVATKENVAVKTFGLILPNGQFTLNNAVLNLKPRLTTYKHKLIYFRRRRETFGQGGQVGSNLVHIIGFEANTDGQVHNTMYIVDEEGRGIVRTYK